MKTIDTSKLWHVHAETNNTKLHIDGPAGVTMILLPPATTEQAQEIADILNAATADQPLYIVTLREGDLEVVYSAPAADEVLWMARQGGIHDDAVTPEAVIKRSNIGQAELAALSAQERAGIAAAECDAWRDRAHDYRAQMDQALSERDNLLRDRAGLQEEIERLTHARTAWEDTARSYLKSMNWYQEQLDRCGRALGHEAYVSDDGSVQREPLRAKVAELVEKMCAERDSAATTGGRPLPNRTVFATASVSGDRPLLRKTSELVERLRAERGHGPCAKQTVRATIVAQDGRRFTGTNDCLNPQTTCPRAGMKTGEGYHLCEQVCQQTGHAEINALRAAGVFARDAVMYVEGHTYVCDRCKVAAVSAGVKEIVFGAPPESEPAPEGKTLSERLRKLADAAEGRIWESVTRLMRKAANEIEHLQEKTSCMMGVGDGSGGLFVYGSYDSIKAAQNLILQPRIPDVPTMRSAFITYESGKDYARIVFKFKSLDEMHQASTEWHKLKKGAEGAGRKGMNDLKVSGVVIAPKIIGSEIVGIRYVRRSSDPAAQPVLQVAHWWSKGAERGLEWSDVPTVDEGSGGRGEPA